jgi:predicted XRE-type DNA-binding protein
MAKIKPVVARNAEELAEALGLNTAEGAEIAFRADLNSKIIEIVKKKKVTHAQLAELASSSRTRITALMNRNTADISTDLMLRVLSALGYKAILKVLKVA